MRVFHQNESCLLALSFLHNSREEGARKAALIVNVMKNSHFDGTPQYLLMRTFKDENEKLCSAVCLFAHAVDILQAMKFVWPETKKG